VVEGLPPLPFFPGGADADAAAFQVNLGRLVEDAGIDPVFVAKFLRRDRNQFGDVVDNLADVVGNASGGVGGVGPLLEDHDVQPGLEPFRLRGGAHSRRVAADDHQSFLCHISHLSIGYSSHALLSAKNQGFRNGWSRIPSPAYSAARSSAARILSSVNAHLERKSGQFACR